METTTFYHDELYTKPDIIRDSQATLSSSSLNPPFSSLSSRQNLLSAWISLRFDTITDLFQAEQVPIDKGLYTLISTGITAYPSTEFVARHHLRTLISETFSYYLSLGYTPSRVQHTDLVIFMTGLSTRMTLQIINGVDSKEWSGQVHAIAYHLEWMSVGVEVRRAEEDLRIAYGLLEEDEDEQVDGEVVSRQTSFIDAALLNPELDLQEELRRRHWEGVVKRFERSWEGHIVKDGSSMTKELIDDAIVLLTSGITLAIHFNEFEIGWTWAERSKLMKNWQILVSLVRLCRKAAVTATEEVELWRARAWVLYKLVLEYGRDGIFQNNYYTEFMGEFMRLIQETEPTLQSLQTLPKILTEMIEYCGQSFFPIPDSTLAPLLQVCWKCRNEPKSVWEASFRKIFEVYVLYKFYKTRRGSTIRLENHGYYFSSDRFVTILSLCTAAGFVEEFEVLNKDLKESKVDEEFVLKVRRGYALFVGRVEDVSEDENNIYEITKLRFDKETLERLNQHLLRLIHKESEFQYINPMDKIQFPQAQDEDYQRLGKEFLERRHEAEFLKQISQFNFQPPAVEDLALEQELAENEIKKTREKQDEIMDLKLNLKAGIQQVTRDYEEMVRERDDMIECLGECRLLDQDYEAVFRGLEVLDGNPLLNQLISERDAVKQEADLLQEQLDLANEAYQNAFNKMNEVEGRLDGLKVKMEEAQEREREAIRISNEKDPRVEELGAWFKETLALTEQMLSISSLTLVSDRKIQIGYFDNEYIVNYVISNRTDRLVDIEFVKGHVQVMDLLDSSLEFPNVNLCLSYLANQVHLRISNLIARKPEMEILTNKGASYDPSSGEVLIQSEISDRCFLFKLDHAYPMGGLKSAKIMMIEVLEEGEDLQGWNDRLEDGPAFIHSPLCPKMSFFDKNPEQFPPPPGIEPKAFLTSCQVLVKLLESLGSAFSPVRSDIDGNIKKLQTRLSSHPSTTLVGLVEGEKSEKTKTATDALLWLKRGLQFTSLALKYNINSTEELSVSFTRAYGETLSKHHSFLVRPIFGMAMGACPTRKGFYESLGGGSPEDKVIEQMKTWVTGLEACLDVIVNYYIQQGLDK